LGRVSGDLLEAFNLLPGDGLEQPVRESDSGQLRRFGYSGGRSVIPSIADMPVDGAIGRNVPHADMPPLLHVHLLRWKPSPITSQN
jgi:hypothetical protein